MCRRDGVDASAHISCEEVAFVIFSSDIWTCHCLEPLRMRTQVVLCDSYLKIVLFQVRTTGQGSRFSTAKARSPNNFAFKSNSCYRRIASKLCWAPSDIQVRGVDSSPTFKQKVCLGLPDTSLKGSTMDASSGEYSVHTRVWQR
jgi:hypothetical protein